MNESLSRVLLIFLLIVGCRSVKALIVSEEGSIEPGFERVSEGNYCKINQYLDRAEGRCMGLPGGGRLVQIIQSPGCDFDTLRSHCSDQRFYYFCGRGETVLASCGLRQKFEQRLQRCVVHHQEFQSQDAGGSGSRSPPEGFLPNLQTICERPGRFPVAEHCDLFYLCETNGQRLFGTVYKCPKATGFDASKGICSPSLVCEDQGSTCAPELVEGQLPDETLDRSSVRTTAVAFGETTTVSNEFHTDYNDDDSGPSPSVVQTATETLVVVSNVVSEGTTEEIVDGISTTVQTEPGEIETAEYFQIANTTNLNRPDLSEHSYEETTPSSETETYEAVGLYQTVNETSTDTAMETTTTVYSEDLVAYYNVANESSTQSTTEIFEKTQEATMESSLEDPTDPAASISLFAVDPAGLINESMSTTGTDSSITESTPTIGSETLIAEPTETIVAESFIAESASTTGAENLITEPTPTIEAENLIAEPASTIGTETLIVESSSTTGPEMLIAEPASTIGAEILIAEPASTIRAEISIAESTSTIVADSLVAESMPTIVAESLIAEPASTIGTETLIAEPVSTTENSSSNNETVSQTGPTINEIFLIEENLQSTESTTIGTVNEIPIGIATTASTANEEQSQSGGSNLKMNSAASEAIVVAKSSTTKPLPYSRNETAKNEGTSRNFEKIFENEQLPITSIMSNISGRIERRMKNMLERIARGESFFGKFFNN